MKKLASVASRVAEVFAIAGFLLIILVFGRLFRDEDKE